MTVPAYLCLRAVGPFGPRASGGLDSHLSKVEQFLMGLAGPPEPILGLGLVARLSVAVEGRHMASVSETEGTDGFLMGHLFGGLEIDTEPLSPCGRGVSDRGTQGGLHRGLAVSGR